MIKFATSKELRLRTRDIINSVKKGDRYIVTYRGKPVALVLPFSDQQVSELTPRLYEDAWADIEKTINESEAAYSNWDEAISESRRRK
jgi:prevent-host-death family protein